jgi:hypothetical protein
MPERTTIVLPEALKLKAVGRARERGISFGEFVRKAVEKELLPSPQKKRLNLKGKKTGDPFWDNLVTYDDEGPADISERIDDYLYGEQS